MNATALCGICISLIACVSARIPYDDVSVNAGAGGRAATQQAPAAGFPHIPQARSHPLWLS